MADIIIVDTHKLKLYAQRIFAVNKRIERLDRRMDDLYASVGLLDLRNLLQADILTCYSLRLHNCKEYLQQTAIDFEEVENLLVSLDPLGFDPYLWKDLSVRERKERNSELIQRLREARNRLLHGVIECGVAESALLISLAKDIHGLWNVPDSIVEKSVLSLSAEHGNTYGNCGFLTASQSISSGISYGSYKHKEKVKEQNEIKSAKYQKNPDEKWYEAQTTIFEKTFSEKKIEGSVFGTSFSDSNDYSESSAEFKFLTGEMHGDISAGMYVYTKDKDGNTKRVFSPGVSAEVGASAALFKLDAHERIGLGENKNMLGLYGDAHVEALSAEVTGKVALSANQLYAKASAEANLAKVSGVAGISVLGTDVGVTASAKVGIGAHAEVGWTDGKLKVDVGAAVGIGFDLGFEVDVSGTVDAVCDAVSDAWDDIADAWDGVTGVIDSIF